MNLESVTMCGAELKTRRPVSGIWPMPWHDFNAGSGAWMLHPSDLHALDPVVLVDHFRMPTPTFAPHPHAGFSAVTYLFESSGEVSNRDSLGNDMVIGPGALHWTQAGHGMLHEELPAETGRTAHGLQIFVNSRSTDKDAPPAAFHCRSEHIPTVQLEGGGQVRVVQGQFDGQGQTLPVHTPLMLLDIHLPAGRSVDLPIPPGHRAFAIVVQGELQQGDTLVPEAHALVFDDAGAVVHLQAGPQPTTQVVLMAGAPLGEPIVPRGPFIANTAEQALQMVRRYQQGEMGNLSARVST